MNRIDALFQQVRARKRPALAAYITAGDPDLAVTNECALALVDAGVELLEYGVPFSDPIADGPVIQRAALRSLRGGAKVPSILDNLRELRASGCETAVSIFGALNPFLYRGLSGLCHDAKAAGADGLLIPDLPPEEADELLPCVEANDLRLAFLAAPTSSRERLQAIADASTGYIYCVALRGVTGERQELPSDLIEFLQRVRDVTDKPILVGFGISKPEHVAALAPHVDALVVGSAFVRIMEEHGTKKDLPERLAKLAGELMDAMK